MKNRPEEMLNVWRKLFQTTPGVVALAVLVGAGVLTMPRLRTQSDSRPSAGSPAADTSVAD